MLKALEEKLKETPDRFTKEALWRAYETVKPGKVKGRVQRFTDLISLVRFAMEHEPVLEPFEAHVHARFATWLAAKSAKGVAFTAEERSWLEKMRDRVIASGSVDREALNAANELGPAYRVFGERLWDVMDELNGALVE